MRRDRRDELALAAAAKRDASRNQRSVAGVQRHLSEEPARVRASSRWGLARRYRIPMRVASIASTAQSRTIRLSFPPTRPRSVTAIDAPRVGTRPRMLRPLHRARLFLVIDRSS